MKTLWLLFLAELKIIFRNRMALFWSLVFPVLFIATFGLFNFEGGGLAKLVIVDQAQNEASKPIVETIKKVDYFSVAESSDRDAAVDDLKKDKVNMVLVIPKELTLPKPAADQPAAGTSAAGPNSVAQSAAASAAAGSKTAAEPVKLEVLYSKANAQTSGTALSAVQGIVTNLNIELTGTPRILTVADTPLETKEIRYIDFLTPGILGFGLMNASIIGLAIAMSTYREKNIFKRMMATPLNMRSYSLAAILAHLVRSLVQIMLILAAAKLLFNVHIYGNWLWLLVVGVMGNLIFLGLGLAIAGFSKTSSAAQGLAQVITLPMMFLAGTFFPTESLPKAVKFIAEKLPLAPIIRMMRDVALNDKTPFTNLNDVWLVTGWIVFALGLALYTFRFHKE